MSQAVKTRAGQTTVTEVCEVCGDPRSRCCVNLQAITKCCDRCGEECGAKYFGDVPGVGDLCPKCHVEWSETIKEFAKPTNAQTGMQCEGTRKDGEPCGTRAYALVEFRNEGGGLESKGWFCGHHQNSLRKKKWRVSLVSKWKMNHEDAGA